MQTSDSEMDRMQRYVETTLGHAGSHGLDHTLRVADVADLCREIGRVEAADMRVLIPAALLHDIAPPIFRASVSHGLFPAPHPLP